MDKNDILNIVSNFKKALEKQGIRTSKIILYGSWAKGRQEEGSDIDIVVISEDFKDKGYWERIQILSDAIYEIFEPVEAIAMTPEEWGKEDTYISNYARNGEVFFGWEKDNFSGYRCN